ncbi:zf-CCHC domain-containing protein/gag_pre-integrs domain-containing protein [Cephalotus follicularis]|uniref:Zf-CCHC domain-containing protein/gag_pre-integrs domain-containing protein n=1 Tax=Cephalotus follicularis TaxID=3775 RepID=A0A1Q3D0Z7_CEPFO|nr:zf-CCHC domain-containing protein/gag_pre-integrs domain-containing protein [Cephalotus follicularis]
MNLWLEYNSLVYDDVPITALSIVQALQEQNMRDQFLMKLRSDYELLHSNLMNRVPSPSLDVYFSELILEEQRRYSQTVLDQHHLPTGATEVAFAAKGKLGNPRTIQCYSCKEYEHIAKDCTKQFCNYCKKEGHIITNCHHRPQNRNNAKAYHAIATESVPTEGSTPLTYIVPTSFSSALTPKSIQQMIVQALTSMGFFGKISFNSRTWYLDYGASNHMTRTLNNLSSSTPYSGPLKICTTDGTKLPINVVGNINLCSISFKDVFFVPRLSTNLLSIGQIVEHDYLVLFSPTGYIIQDLTTGKMIGRGRKSGKLFPIHLDNTTPASADAFGSIPSALSVFHPCNKSELWTLWHHRLGYPHSNKLLTMFNSGLLPTKVYVSNKDVLNVCSNCCMAQSKTLPVSNSTHVSPSLFN